MHWALHPTESDPTELTIKPVQPICDSLWWALQGLSWAAQGPFPFTKSSLLATAGTRPFPYT